MPISGEMFAAGIICTLESETIKLQLCKDVFNQQMLRCSLILLSMHAWVRQNVFFQGDTNKAGGHLLLRWPP